MKRTIGLSSVGHRRSGRTADSHLLTVCLTALSCFGFGERVRAQNVELAQAAVAPLAFPTTPAPPSVPVVGPYAEYDPLRWKGLTVPLPGPVDTIDQQFFGIRKALADVGIGYLGFTNDNFQDNLVRHSLPAPAAGNRQNQLYNGQLPTYSTSNFGYVTFDLARYGIPDGQIVVGGVFLRTNWNPLGPNAIGLSQATYYQTLLHGLLEFKIGYLSNSLEFLGTYVGGSIAGGIFGPSASLPVEQGENATVYTTPGVNLKVNFSPVWYDKVGVQRAISPDGDVVEHNENISGVRFTVPNAGVLVINEAGYRVSASPGVPQVWVRAAASYTSSKYIDDTKPAIEKFRSDNNYGLYLLADRQLWQRSSHVGRAAQGVYAGFSVEYVPPSLNRFSQYYEARLYGFGLIPTRPRDQTSLVFTDNVFSGYLVDTARNAKQLAHDSTQALTLSYSAHVYPGINLNIGVSYIDNPTSVTYTTTTGSAVNILLGTVAFF